MGPRRREQWGKLNRPPKGRFDKGGYGDPEGIRTLDFHRDRVEDEGEPPATPPEDEAPPEVPPAIERYEAFNYSECVKFAAELYFMDRDWDRINKRI